MPVLDAHFSTFYNGGNPVAGDIIVGLRDGINTKFNWIGGGGGGGGISNWQTISAPNITVAGGDGIVADTPVTPLQVVLPMTFNVGDEVGVMGVGAGGWNLVANSGQTIIFGSVVTSMAGYIASDIQNATIFIRGLVANQTWIVTSVNSNPTYF
jgi:hypothetical protein